MEPTSVDSNMESAMISPYSAKRPRKDPKVTTGKSVVVLRTSDVRVRSDFVFMPNTIEMAQLKKQSRGQFKTNVQISSQMTKTDVEHTLIDNFPILRDKRFFCASVVDNRTRLEFHGERRIWDGHQIKKVIKGNSALYIFVEEEGDFGESEVVEDSGYESTISAIREQLGIKRSFDQIAREMTSSESPVQTSLSSINGPAQQLPGVISTPDGPSENITYHSNLVSGQAEKSAEKSEVELSNERPLMNIQQEIVAPSNTILLLHNPLQQPLQMGGIPFFVFPTAGGIPVAPAPTAGNNALNTVPAQQSLEMPILPTSNNPGLQTAPQASGLTPQLQSLRISSASSQQPQNIVTSEASLLGSSEALTTVDTTEISQQLSLTGAEGDRTDLEGGQQETENLKSPDQEEPNVEKTDSSQVPEKESAEAIAVAGDQESSGLATLQISDIEPLLSEDSGFGTFEKSEENILQDIHIAPAGAATRGDTYAKNVMLLKNEDLAQRDGNILMPTTIEMARMRKTGQYKKQVQFSKSMSEDAVRKKIQETFPAFDLSVRFSCASISNTDSTLQFHGDPRVWDGKTIRRILKGNSALYIVMPMPAKENGLEMLSKVASAVKEREEGEKDSGFLSNRVPIEERMDVEMASETLLEKDRIEPLSSEDLSEKLEDILEIFPNRGPMQGGLSFLLVFGQGLPPEVESAWANFGMKTVADLKRVNAFNLIGRIPASDEPGKVTVTVYSSTGRILGKTDFDYYDQDRETLLRLVKDPELQSEFFCHWADFMVDKRKRGEGKDLPQPSAGFSPPNQVLRVLVRIATNYTSQQLFELFSNSPAARRAVFLAYKLMRRFSDENWDDQEFPPTVDRLVIGAEEAQRRPNHTDEIKEAGYLSDEESSSSESSCSETFHSEDNSSTTSSEDHADEIKETGYLGDEEPLSSKSSSSESSYSEDNSSTTSIEDHTDEIKETKYEGDEESSSCKSSSSETSYSEDKSSTTSSEDQNPTSEECCGPVTVAKYGRKIEAEEVSLMKACMEFVGQDLSRLEPKPKVNDQERGGSSSEEDFSPGEHKREVGYLCSNVRESRRQNIQQRNPVFNLNFDQNSIAEKTRRAKERSDEEETGDLNGAPL